MLELRLAEVELKDAHLFWCCAAGHRVERPQLHMVCHGYSESDDLGLCCAVLSSPLLVILQWATATFYKTVIVKVYAALQGQHVLIALGAMDLTLWEWTLAFVECNSLHGAFHRTCPHC